MWIITKKAFINLCFLLRYYLHSDHNIKVTILYYENVENIIQFIEYKTL